MPDAPPLIIDLVPSTTDGRAVTAAPALPLSLDLLLPETEPTTPPKLTLVSPVDGATVPVARPEFAFGFEPPPSYVPPTYEVEYEWSDGQGFFLSEVFQVDLEEMGGVITPSQDLPETVTWRARVRENGLPVLTFSDPLTLHISQPGQDFTDISLMWYEFTLGDPAIHLWLIDPPGADIGDTVTVFGQGFPEDCRVLIGDTQCQVLSRTVVPETAASATGARAINYDVVDPEHIELQVIIPEFEEPGGPMIVEAA